MLNKIFNIFSQLLIVPLYLKFWGKEYYGEWLLLSIIPNYLLLSDFGLNVTATTEICRLVIDKKYEEAKTVFKSVNTFFAFISLVIVVVFFIFISVFNLKNLLNFRLIANFDACLAFFFQLITVLISIFWGILIGTFRAGGRFDKEVNYSTLIAIIDILVIGVVLLNKLTILSLTSIQMVIRIGMYFWLILIVSNNYPWFKYGFSFNYSIIKRLLPASSYYMLLTFGHAMILQGTAFIVGKHLGAINLVTFNTSRTLANSVKSFSSIIYMSFVPEFTNYIFKNDINNANKAYYRMMYLVGFLSLSMSIFLLIFGAIIFDFWTNKRLNLPYSLFSLMLLSVIFQSLWNASCMIPLSVNKTSKIRLFAPFSLLFIVVLNYIIKYRDLNTVGLGLIIFDLTMFIYTLRVTKQILKDTFNKQ